MAERAPAVARAANVLYSVALPGAMLVSLRFWIRAPLIGTRLLTPANVYVHVANVCVMAADAICNAQVLQLAWIVYFTAAVVVFIVWTVIFAALRLRLPPSACADCPEIRPQDTAGCYPDGSCAFVLAALDWNKPMTAAFATAVSLVVVVPALYMFAWALDTSVARCGFKGPPAEAEWNRPCSLRDMSPDTGARWVHQFGQSAFGRRPRIEWLLFRAFLALSWTGAMAWHAVVHFDAWLFLLCSHGQIVQAVYLWLAVAATSRAILHPTAATLSSAARSPAAMPPHGARVVRAWT